MNSRFWMIGMLLIMAVVCSTALALVNIVTSPIIEKNNEIKYMSTVLDVFGVEYNSDDSDAVIVKYKDAITESETDGISLFTEKASGSSATSISGSGFQGPITVIVALDGDEISGFKVVSQVETPGLGARITEDGFQQSFVGKKVAGGIKMSRTGNAGISEFDAITGATETSKSLESLLNKGFASYFEKIRD
ncbi:FMN-binding protein [Candidatus Latescibacterota bacterium]